MGTLRITTKLRDNDTNEDLSINNLSVTTTGGNLDGRTVTVTQAGEYTFTIDTDVGDAGYCAIINRDDTNYIKIGFATSDYKLRLKAGETALFRLDPAVSALYMIADTADCEAQLKIYED